MMKLILDNRLEFYNFLFQLNCRKDEVQWMGKDINESWRGSELEKRIILNFSESSGT